MKRRGTTPPSPAAVLIIQPDELARQSRSGDDRADRRPRPGSFPTTGSPAPLRTHTHTHTIRVIFYLVLLQRNSFNERSKHRYFSHRIFGVFFLLLVFRSFPRMPTDARRRPSASARRCNCSVTKNKNASAETRTKSVPGNFGGSPCRRCPRSTVSKVVRATRQITPAEIL